MLTKELIANVRRIEIRTRRIVDELTAGAYHSVFKGKGMEFEKVREYIPGDDVRSIDWNVTARMGYPYIKSFVEERELTVFLLVDISASGDFGTADRSKKENAAELAALLAFSAVRNNDRVGLLMFSDKTELYLPPKKGKKHTLRLIRELLASERKNSKTDIKNALETMMKVINKKAVVFLISDMFDSDFKQPLNIASKRHDVTVIRLLDKYELSPKKAGLINIEDAETGEISLINSNKKKILDNAKKYMDSFRSEQDSICRSSGIDLIDIVNGEDYVHPLMQFFKKRERKMH